MYMPHDMSIKGRVCLGQAVVLRGAGVALWGKHESQEIFFTELGNAGVVKAPWAC
jgi:hypothetical protein